MAAAELVFTYESAVSNVNADWDGAGTAFLMELYGSTYIVTNRHVLDSIIIDGHKEFALTNQFGRQLLITSPIYYQLKKQQKPTGVPSNISKVTYDGIWNDLILIPYSMDYFVMSAFKPSRRVAEISETAFAFGNTEGQGYINAKEGLVNYIDEFCFGLISGARKGNSGGPVITLTNEVIGMLSSGGGPKGEDGADQSICIRVDLDTLAGYYYDGQFEAIGFPDDVVHYYTETLVTEYTPEPHHSRDKNTPHLSMGLAVSNLDDVDSVWDMKIRGNHRPLECYNWDVIPRDRLIKLCETYGQTVIEFIPKEWFKTYYDATITAAKNAHKQLENAHTSALRHYRKMGTLETREEKMKYALEKQILDPLRVIFNARHETGKKMRLNGEIVEISECIISLDAGL